MFHPMVAGVTIPGVALGIPAGDAPVRRQEPVAVPEGLASSRSPIFTMFIMLWAVLVIIGSLLPR